LRFVAERLGAPAERHSPGVVLAGILPLGRAPRSVAPVLGVGSALLNAAHLIANSSKMMVRHVAILFRKRLHIGRYGLECLAAQA